MENITEALLLMMVGMSTVFIILLIVIYTGKALIELANRYLPEEKPAKMKRTSSAPATQPTSEISSATISAISVAIHLATEGKGRIAQIEKL